MRVAIAFDSFSRALIEYAVILETPAWVASGTACGGYRSSKVPRSGTVFVANTLELYEVCQWNRGLSTSQVEHPGRVISAKTSTAAETRFLFITSSNTFPLRMSKANSRQARRMRDQLLAALGPRCVVCGATEDLTFDCVIPRGPEHHKLCWCERLKFYLDQARSANVAVLCRRCNGRKGGGILPPYLPNTSAGKGK